MENLWNKKTPKSTLLADNNTLGLITTKQTKPGPAASAAPHPTTPAKYNRRISMKNIVVGGEENSADAIEL